MTHVDAGRHPMHVYWLSRDGCSKCRWDEWFVEDLLAGVLFRPPGFPSAVRETVTNAIQASEIPEAAVVVFPGGAHTAADDPDWLNEQLSRLDRVILFITSDEASTFPIDRIVHPDITLWVMTPRPEITYPEGTTFIGDGSARAGEHVATWWQEIPEKIQDWFFAGQVTHPRREQAVAGCRAIPPEYVGSLTTTASFLSGMPRDRYLDQMAISKVVPAPSGIQSQDSFRAFEALEMGAVPVLDGLRPDGGGSGYWNMLFPGSIPVPIIEDWRDLPGIVREIVERWPRPAIEAHGWWLNHRNRLARRLRDQWRTFGAPRPNGAEDDIIVFIPTSPIPSHPSTAVISDVIESIRDRMDSQIVLLIDGVRREQTERAADYAEYVRRLMMHCEHDWFNVVPMVFDKHLHQATMTRRALEHHGSAGYMLFVEHDTPLVGPPIPWSDLIAEMNASGLDAMRLHYDETIHPDHEHLMVDTDVVRGAFVSYRRTAQWSQRPHLARTQWYCDRVMANFANSSRTMIEDVMHGVVDYAWRVHGEEGWKQWRLAIYCPDGGFKRSGHSDGRGGDPKYGMRFRYNGAIPPGAPHPQVGY